MMKEVEVQAQIHYEVTKQANAIIAMLREIAIKGKQSQPDLAKSTGFAYRTIMAVMVRDRKKDSIQQMFCVSGTRNVNGIDQNLYSLTQFGIVVLLRSHFKNIPENVAKGIVGEPYLSHNEFKKFISRFSTDYDKSTDVGEVPLHTYSSIYFANNPKFNEKILSKFKDDEKIKKINTSIKSIDSKIQQLEDEKIIREHERYEIMTESLMKSKT